MTQVFISIDIDDRKVRRLLNDVAFLGKLERHLQTDLTAFATWAGSEVRKEIESGSGYSPLGIQRMIKGHGKVLVHTRNLYRNVAFKFEKGRHTLNFLIGVGAGQVPSGTSLEKVGEILAKGTEFMPSEKQRSAVFAKAREAGYEPAARGQKKEIWKIPSRPFIERALGKESASLKFAMVCLKSLEKTCAEMAR